MLTAFSILSLTSWAQSNILFYHTDGFYNAPNYNPASLTKQKNFTFNIFPMAGVGYSYNNREAFNMVSDILFSEDVTDESKELFRKLIKKDVSYNYVETNLINLGINSAYGSFDFQIKEKAYALMRYGGEFSRFLMDTTGLETARLEQIQEFPTVGLHLREYSLGYANEIIRNKLDIGVRLKLYYGKSFLTSTVEGQMIDENSTYYAKSQGDVFFSIPAADNEQNGVITKIAVMDGYSVMDYVFNRKNSGFGLDLGINWKINPYLTFTASVLDLGEITWKEYLYKLNFDGGLYEIQNVHLDPDRNVLIKETDEVNLVDNIDQLFEIANQQNQYKTKIPTTFYAGLNYKLSESLSLGIVNRYIQVEKMGHNSFSALANYKRSDKLTIIAGLGVYGTSFKNIPIGIQYRWRAAQFYIGTDNVLSLFAPDFSDYSSLTFGVDFNLFGPKVKYKKVKYLPFFKLKKQRRKRSDGLIFKGSS